MIKKVFVTIGAIVITIGVVLIVSGGDKEAFIKGDIAELECKSLLIKSDNLIPGTKGEVRYKIQVQNCTRSMTAMFNNSPSSWADAKATYNIK
jgi:hypothetical protein